MNHKTHMHKIILQKFANFSCQFLHLNNDKKVSVATEMSSSFFLLFSFSFNFAKIICSKCQNDSLLYGPMWYHSPTGRIFFSCCISPLSLLIPYTLVVDAAARKVDVSVRFNTESISIDLDDSLISSSCSSQSLSRSSSLANDASISTLAFSKARLRRSIVS